MSAALQILSYAADALAVHHDDALVLQPGRITVTGYAEDAESVTEGSSVQRLHIADESFTHTIHIRRSVLVEAYQTEALRSLLQKVNTVETDTGRTYRVHNFLDDPSRPTIAFQCSLI